MRKHKNKIILTVMILIVFVFSLGWLDAIPFIVPLGLVSLTAGMLILG